MDQKRYIVHRNDSFNFPLELVSNPANPTTEFSIFVLKSHDEEPPIESRFRAVRLKVSDIDSVVTILEDAFHYWKLIEKDKNAEANSPVLKFTSCTVKVQKDYFEVWGKNSNGEEVSRIFDRKEEAIKLLNILKEFKHAIFES